MLQQAIESVASLASGAEKLRGQLALARFDKNPFDPTKYFVQHDGSFEEREVPSSPRAHHVSDQESFIRLATRAKEKSANPVIWHSDNQVVLVWDDDERRERATWPLNKTEVWQSIVYVDGSPYKQPQMIDVLRFALADVLTAPELLNIVRKIKFKRSSDAYGEVTQGRESLGRSVENEVTGADALPEDVLLHGVNVYEELLHPLDLRFGLNIDVNQELFTLKALAGVLPAAVRLSQLALGEALTNSVKSAGIEVPVFFGTP